MSTTPDTKPDQKPDDKPTDDKPTQQGDPAKADDKPLGPNGEKALEAERTARKAAEKAIADLQAKLETNRANESDVEKARREAKEALDLANKATAEALRLRVAAKHGISDDDADLFLTGTDRDTLEAQAKRLAERASTAPKPDRSQGGSGADLPLNSDPLLADLKSKLGIA